MRRPSFHARAVPAVLGLLLACGLASAGCKKSDTILLIEISGPQTNDFVPFQFQATISVGEVGETKAFDMPTPSRPSPLPQSFTIALDRSHSGPVKVSIIARDEHQNDIGYGTTTQEHIVIGGQTVIAVALTAELPPDEPDGGATDADGGDEAADAGDAAAGTDAADAPKGDAPADAPDDGMGLDDASD